MSRTIQLTNGAAAIVDEQDYEMLSEHHWYWHANGGNAYARRLTEPHEPRSKMYMHRQIMLPASGLVVDHINGNGLDNRRANLRMATQSQNRANTHRSPNQVKGRFKGVYLHKQSGRWIAGIANSYIGIFINPEEAALAYDAAARERFGEFAYCNYPDES